MDFAPISRQPSERLRFVAGFFSLQGLVSAGVCVFAAGSLLFWPVAGARYIVAHAAQAITLATSAIGYLW
ncbi:MAG TPA: hypothetical protein VE967_02165, partial [Gemmatimonadaceae bacterium]|nr:hypothetical protein [Gemmatimonadaceae bacterium]